MFKRDKKSCPLNNNAKQLMISLVLVSLSFYSCSSQATIWLDKPDILDVSKGYLTSDNVYHYEGDITVTMQSGDGKCASSTTSSSDFQSSYLTYSSSSIDSSYSSNTPIKYVLSINQIGQSNQRDIMSDDGYNYHVTVYFRGTSATEDDTTLGKYFAFYKNGASNVTACVTSFAGHYLQGNRVPISLTVAPKGHNVPWTGSRLTTPLLVLGSYMNGGYKEEMFSWNSSGVAPPAVNNCTMTAPSSINLGSFKSSTIAGMVTGEIVEGTSDSNWTSDPVSVACSLGKTSGHLKFTGATAGQFGVASSTSVINAWSSTANFPLQLAATVKAGNDASNAWDASAGKYTLNSDTSGYTIRTALVLAKDRPTVNPGTYNGVVTVEWDAD